MNVKIDTKEIFYVISLNEENLTANMAEFMENLLRKGKMNQIKALSLILRMLMK